MRLLLPALLLLAPAPALAQAPAGQQPPVLRIPGLSPAGAAALDKFRERQNPAVPAQLQEEAAVRQQMQSVLSAPTLDLDKFAAAQAHARAVSATGRKIIDDNVLTMLRALPPGDRKAFLNAIAHPQVAAQGSGGSGR